MGLKGTSFECRVNGGFVESFFLQEMCVGIIHVCQFKVFLNQYEQIYKLFVGIQFECILYVLFSLNVQKNVWAF
jgi:hypothetical protein